MIQHGGPRCQSCQSPVGMDQESEATCYGCGKEVCSASNCAPEFDVDGSSEEDSIRYTVRALCAECAQTRDRRELGIEL